MRKNFRMMPNDVFWLLIGLTLWIGGCTTSSKNEFVECRIVEHFSRDTVYRRVYQEFNGEALRIEITDTISASGSDTDVILFDFNPRLNLWKKDSKDFKIGHHTYKIDRYEYDILEQPDDHILLFLYNNKLLIDYSVDWILYTHYICNATDSMLIEMIMRDTTGFLRHPSPPEPPRPPTL